MEEFNPMPASIFLYVKDCDLVYQLALQAGGSSVMEPTAMSHAGERYGGVKDPSGNIWWIATHIEDVSPEEQARRIAESFKNDPSGNCPEACRSWNILADLIENHNAPLQ